MPLWGSVAYFRHGRLAGALVMFGLQLEEAEKQRIEDSVKALASVMNDRMASVLVAEAPAAAVP